MHFIISKRYIFIYVIYPFYPLMIVCFTSKFT